MKTKTIVQTVLLSVFGCLAINCEELTGDFSSEEDVDMLWQETPEVYEASRCEQERAEHACLILEAVPVDNETETCSVESMNIFWNDSHNQRLINECSCYVGPSSCWLYDRFKKVMDSPDWEYYYIYERICQPTYTGVQGYLDVSVSYDGISRNCTSRYYYWF